jgi:hypothetical protein
MKDDRGVVGRFDGGNHAKGALLWGFVGGILDELKRRFDVSGSYRAAVVEANTAAKMETYVSGSGIDQDSARSPRKFI